MHLNTFFLITNAPYQITIPQRPKSRGIQGIFGLDGRILFRTTREQSSRLK